MGLIIFKPLAPTMKPLFCLFSLLLSSSLIGQYLPTETLDTLSSPSKIIEWTMENSRANVFENPQLSHQALSLAKKKLEAINDTYYLAEWNLEHGIMHSIRQEPDSALIYYKQAIALYSPQEDSVRMGYSYRNLGVAFDMLEQFPEALEAHFKSLQFLPVDDSTYRPLTYLEVAKSLYRLKNNTRSYSYAKQAAGYFESRNDYFNLSSAYNSMGLALLNIKDSVERSISVLTKSVELSVLLGDSIGLTNHYVNLGIAYSQLPQSDSALHYLNKAYNSKHIDPSREEYIRLTIRANQASILESEGDYENALIIAKEILAKADSGRYNFILERAALTASKSNKALGNTEAALNDLEYYVRVLRKNVEIQNESRMASYEQEMLVKYRDKENELLRRENELTKAQFRTERTYLYIGIILLTLLSILLLQSFLIVRKRRKMILENLDKLNELDKAKNRLFSIIGHDLRGPVGNSLFLLKELPQVGDRLSSDTENILDNVRNALTEVHGLLENLLLWAREQAADMSIKRTTVSINPILKQSMELTSPLLPLRNMKIKAEVLPDNLSWKVDANAFGTILRNLLSNALKYAPENGEVTCQIRIDSDTSQMVLKVCDTGTGIPKSIQDHLDVPSVNQKDLNSGLGLKLVHLLVNQHGGTLLFEQDEKGRACVVCTFPA